MSGGTFNVREASWIEDGNDLLEVRTAVFVVEQGVDVEIERDGKDARCWHVLAADGEGSPIGAGRLSPEGKVGRVSVLKAWRGRGVGEALMRALLARADSEQMAETYLHSQVDAMAFYARFGFVPQGGEFEEAGIAHQRMVRRQGAERE